MRGITLIEVWNKDKNKNIWQFVFELPQTSSKSEGVPVMENPLSPSRVSAIVVACHCQSLSCCLLFTDVFFFTEEAVAAIEQVRAPHSFFSENSTHLTVVLAISFAQQFFELCKSQQYLKGQRSLHGRCASVNFV